MEPVIVGRRYEIQQLLNRGSFGAVYAGRHVRTGQQVAIKFETADAGLKHETTIVQYLHNLGVRQITEILWFGRFDRFHALVMPFYPTDILGTGRAHLDILFDSILRILGAVHSHFVVHRDIKPQNFLLKDPANPTSVHLTDFGMATFVLDASGNHYTDEMGHHTDEMGHHMIGTPKYASLNVHAGHRYSRRDDLLSVAYMYIVMTLGGPCPWIKEGKVDIEEKRAILESSDPILEKGVKFLAKCSSLDFSSVLSEYSML